MSDSLRPHGLQHTRLPCPSLYPRVCSDSCLLSRQCHPTISSSVTSFSSCPQSFPTSRYFPMNWLLASGGQSIGASASASVLPMNMQSWSSLGLTGLISLMSKGLSRVFSNTTVESINSLALSLFYSPTFTSLHDYWIKVLKIIINIFKNSKNETYFYKKHLTIELNFLGTFGLLFLCSLFSRGHSHTHAPHTHCSSWAELVLTLGCLLPPGLLYLPERHSFLLSNFFTNCKMDPCFSLSPSGNFPWPCKTIPLHLDASSLSHERSPFIAQITLNLLNTGSEDGSMISQGYN